MMIEMMMMIMMMVMRMMLLNLWVGEQTCAKGTNLLAIISLLSTKLINICLQRRCNDRGTKQHAS